MSKMDKLAGLDAAELLKKTEPFGSWLAAWPGRPGREDIVRHSTFATWMAGNHFVFCWPPSIVASGELGSWRRTRSHETQNCRWSKFSQGTATRANPKRKSKNRQGSGRTLVRTL